MTGLQQVFIVVMIMAATATIGWFWILYHARVNEIDRDARWHRMWHERIWQDEDEPRGH